MAVAEVWPKVKALMTTGRKPRTVGYIQSLRQAAVIFATISPHLKRRVQEEAVFNEDKELTEALVTTIMLEGEGGI